MMNSKYNKIYKYTHFHTNKHTYSHTYYMKNEMNVVTLVHLEFRSFLTTSCIYYWFINSTKRRKVCKIKS